MFAYQLNSNLETQSGKNASIRFKGHSTRYYPKKSYRIRFPSANIYHGIRDINFNSMYTDKSLMREKLAWDLYKDLKSISPFCFHANLYINNSYKGLFTFIDRVDLNFLSYNGMVTCSLNEADDTYVMASLTQQSDSLLSLYYDIIDKFVYTCEPLAGPDNVLKNRWISNPVFLDMFRSKLKYILDSIFTEKNYYKRIESLKNIIESRVIKDNYKWGTTQGFYQHIEAQKYYITVRRYYLYSTFINEPSGTYNNVTLPISKNNIPYHFIAFDGRTIATMWFRDFMDLDNINLRAYPNSVPPFMKDPQMEKFIKR